MLWGVFAEEEPLGRGRSSLWGLFPRLPKGLGAGEAFAWPCKLMQSQAGSRRGFVALFTVCPFSICYIGYVFLSTGKCIFFFQVLVLRTDDCCVSQHALESLLEQTVLNHRFSNVPGGTIADNLEEQNQSETSLGALRRCLR